ncbi:MAG: glycosyltransferase family 4 protein [bacterium]|nr:glycosyltransferase family 4 protein [bacterium]
MITVCHIITKLELGGAQQNTLYTVKHLDRTQFRPLLITSPEGILVQDAERCRDVPKYYVSSLLRELRPFQDLKAFLHIRRILKQEATRNPQAPFIVHTHSSKAGIIGRWAAKSVGIFQIVHSIHGFSFHRYQGVLTRRFYILLEWLSAKITRHFIAVSSANIDSGMRLGFFPASRVSLIRSGIDIARFRQFSADVKQDFGQWRTRKRRELNISPEQPLIGIVACFKPQKAPLDFVLVMQQVVKHVPDSHAVMVGDGVLRPRIEALIAEYGLEQQISLLGWRHDIPELLPLFDVLVLTSYWEGLPRVCPQAMAAGLPIVATNVDGIPEAVYEGKNGFLCQPGDIEGMAQKLQQLLQHPELARRMGQEAQARVAEFDSELMVRQQEELYRSLGRKT